MGRTRPAANKGSADPKRSQANKLTDAMSDTKAELLTSIKEDISVLLRSELKDILAEEFGRLKIEIQAVKNEVVSNISLLRSDLDCVKNTVTDMELSLTTCSDDVSSLQTIVGKLQAEVKSLQGKYIDMEARMRRNNIQILNVPEDGDSSSPATSAADPRETLPDHCEAALSPGLCGYTAPRREGREETQVRLSANLNLSRLPSQRGEGESRFQRGETAAARQNRDSLRSYSHGQASHLP